MLVNALCTCCNNEPEQKLIYNLKSHWLFVLATEFWILLLAWLRCQYFTSFVSFYHVFMLVVFPVILHLLHALSTVTWLYLLPAEYAWGSTWNAKKQQLYTLVSYFTLPIPTMWRMPCAMMNGLRYKETLLNSTCWMLAFTLESS